MQFKYHFVLNPMNYAKVCKSFQESKKLSQTNNIISFEPCVVKKKNVTL